MATSLVSKINTSVALLKGWVNSFLAFMGQLYLGFYTYHEDETGEHFSAMDYEYCVDDNSFGDITYLHCLIVIREDRGKGDSAFE